MWLAGEIEALGPFELLSRGEGIPAFAFRLREGSGYSVYDVSESLRGRGWIVPAYRMPPGLDDVAVLRVVVRNGFSRDLAALFLGDLGRVIERLHRPAEQPADEVRTGFHH
jgi:glutamate decarboxylase